MKLSEAIRLAECLHIIVNIPTNLCVYMIAAGSSLFEIWNITAYGCMPVFIDDWLGGLWNPQTDHFLFPFLQKHKNEANVLFKDSWLRVSFTTIPKYWYFGFHRSSNADALGR